MKNSIYLKAIIVFSVFVKAINVEGQVINNNVGYIPQSCQIAWTNAGLLPSTSFCHASVGNGIIGH